MTAISMIHYSWDSSNISLKAGPNASGATIAGRSSPLIGSAGPATLKDAKSVTRGLKKTDGLDAFDDLVKKRTGWSPSSCKVT